ncbi:MAG: helix-turn-helix transcriptional regulator [Fulvimarina manganoxydans]|nr:helix-turn-helix transcriptional regulator [Fulvimarina manganoxydans]
MENALKDRVSQRLHELQRTPAEATRLGGLERTFIHDLLAGKKKTVRGPNIARLAKALEVSSEWVISGEDEHAHVTPSASFPRPNASFPPRYEPFPQGETVPLLGQIAGGPNGRFILNGAEIDRLFCPPNLLGVEGAYAVKIFGTSMEPRFRAGEAVWINPHEPVRKGDDVVLQLLTEDGERSEAYIKEFVSRSSKLLRLFQHNPEEGETNELEFPEERVFSVHKIVFHAPV